MEALIKDLKDLLKEAEDGEFGDFTNNKYAAPKIALVEKLEGLKTSAINGAYDG